MESYGFFSCPAWTGISAITLIITLAILIWYAWSTRQIAKLQAEEIGLKKRPVISIECRGYGEGHFYFLPNVANLSIVHGKARIMAKISVNGEDLPIPSDWHYSGGRFWHLQAGCQIGGNINLTKLFHLKTNKKLPPLNDLKAEIIFKVWVINFHDDEKDLYDNRNMNPICKWYWDGDKMVWIPEVAPET